MTRILKSIHHALNGVVLHWKIGKNFKIQVWIGLLVVITGLFLDLNPWEWVSIIITIGIVLALETFNSALETLCNVVSPAIDPKIKAVKDLAAAGVLLFCFIALIIGVIIFLPRLYPYLIA